MNGTEAPANFLFDRFKACLDNPAFAFEGEEFTYRWLRDRISYWQSRFQTIGIRPGSVVAITGDYSPDICALLLSLIDLKAIIVPFASYQGQEQESLATIAEVQFEFSFDRGNCTELKKYDRSVTNALTGSVVDKQVPGLIVFSSGSTGKPKGILHDFSKVLEKFKQERKTLRTLAFLQLDHLGGINTLLYVLSNCGTVISIAERTPAAICKAIEEYRIELLPVTPSFLNLMIASGEYKKWDMSSLKVVSYGTEMMPEATLNAMKALFPQVQLQQTYGLSELGVLRTKSREDGSLWVKVGGEGFQTKVVHETLWIKADSQMVGYLNHPQPFDNEGWFNTEDQVEVNGDYVRFLGRKCDIINVAGLKVFPSEVENVLMEMDNVKDVVVRAEKNFLVGNIVVARFSLMRDEELDSLKKRVRQFCAGKLSPHKIPQKVEIADGNLYGARFKRLRDGVASDTPAGSMTGRTLVNQD